MTDIEFLYQKKGEAEETLRIAEGDVNAAEKTLIGAGEAVLVADKSGSKEYVRTAINAYKDAEKALDEAMAKAQKAKEELDEINAEIAKAENPEEETTRSVSAEDEYPTRQKAEPNKNRKFITGLIIGAIAGGIVGYVLVKESRTGRVVTSGDDVHVIGADASVMPITTTPPTDKPTIDYDSRTNVAVVSTPEPIVYEELTTEEFESLVDDYAKIFEDSNVTSINTRDKGEGKPGDIKKFVSVVNIDKLAEDNPELIKELAGDQTKEEYLNDAAKVIGAAVMKNFTIWNTTNSTEGFIKVSDAVFGDQKANVLKVEEYTDKIAAAAKEQDADLVNSLVSEFITELNSGSLSKLDDGVGFGIQVNIAVIADGIARNYLNKENFDKFQILKTSEKYVSNIFTVYEGCLENVNGKTLTLTK